MSGGVERIVIRGKGAVVVVVVLGSGNSGDELASGDQDKCVDGKKRDKQTQLMVVTRKRHRERAEQTERQTATRRTEVPNEASEITISDSPDHVILRLSHTAGPRAVSRPRCG